MVIVRAVIVYSKLGAKGNWDSENKTSKPAITGLLVSAQDLYFFAGIFHGLEEEWKKAILRIVPGRAGPGQFVNNLLKGRRNS